MATVAAIMDALAAQITTQLAAVENLQVTARMHHNPTPPCIDIYPSDPFTERSAMGDEFSYFFSVRCRVSTADHEAGQDTLLELMNEPGSHAHSLTAAIQSDPDLGNLVDDVTVVEGPSAFGYFLDPGSLENRLLGSVWRVQVIP